MDHQTRNTIFQLGRTSISLSTSLINQSFGFLHQRFRLSEHLLLEQGVNKLAGVEVLEVVNALAHTYHFNR